MANRPEPEIEITQPLVRALLRDQCPALADLPLRELSRGWDNTNFRLGDDVIVRVPHRQVAAPLVLHEQSWLPILAAQLDMPIPSPIHAGAPTLDYPWPWSVTPFFAGADAVGHTLNNPANTATMLGTFFRQLHTTAPTDAPVNKFRGCPLVNRATSFATNVDQIDDQFDRDRITAIFETACAIPPSSEHVWLHGDLHIRNMVVDHGELSAVIDWGDICAGDRATDLAGAFMLVPGHIDTVADHAGADDAAWERARGWAAHFAVVYLAHSDDDPIMERIGTDLFTTLLAL